MTRELSGQSEGVERGSDGSDGAAVVVFRLDADGRIMTWNSACERLLGYGPAEIVRRSSARLYCAEDAHRSGEALDVADVNGLCETTGWRRRKDGTCLFVRELTTALRDEAGALIGFDRALAPQTPRAATNS